MKKLVLAITAIAALVGSQAGSAVAADLSARTYTKAPILAPVPSWTGFYIFGGGGYGVFDANTYSTTFPGKTALTIGQTVGGDGYFGTAGVGYDWQYAKWVGGIFADGQFGSIKGSLTDPFNAAVGKPSDKTSAAAGVRLGYLVAPSVLSYVNGGYSYAQFSGTTLLNNVTGLPFANLPRFSRNGWFLGGGVENNFDIFGFSAPGWFMKTEYRVANYQRVNLGETTGGALTGFGVSTKPIVQTVSTSLVYRFNWGGPVVAKY